MALSFTTYYQVPSDPGVLLPEEQNPVQPPPIMMGTAVPTYVSIIQVRASGA